jgi:hypothetical protein
MIIKQRAIEQIEQFVTKVPEAAKGLTRHSDGLDNMVEIPAAGEGVGASVSIVDFDRYSVAFNQLDVYVSDQQVAAEERDDYLRRVAAEICQRLTYLEEPLELLEFNRVDAVAQLRSNPPDRYPTETIYWEVAVRTLPSPRAQLTRYRWNAGNGQRVPVAYPATFATVGRLIEDLAQSVADVTEVVR